MRSKLRMRLSIALLIFGSALLFGQTAGTGALTGTVTDPTGAVIPNATVTLTSADTGQERTTTSGADGTYRFTLLPPGTYRVRFSATGFKPAELTGIRINVTENPVLNRSLEVGAQTEQVTVEANVETIQTASSTLGTTVTGNTATALPLTTRNYTNLLGLSAGANASVNNATGFGKGGMDIAVNGGNTGQNNFQMDGVSITNYGGAGSVIQGFYSVFAIPNPDTLQEFKIQTSNYDAGYGRNPGANVNVVTKSGTNTLHGTGYEFFRNTDMNANDFFLNRAGRARAVFNQNQFGGTLGGPIKKDKLFVFGAYEQRWQKNGASAQGLSSGIVLPPIPVMDRGHTSLSGVNDAPAAAFQQALGAAFCHSNPNPGGAPGQVGMTVACNGSNINPVAMRYLQARNPYGGYYIPGSGTSGNLPGVIYSIPAYDREYQGMLNFDYIISPKHTLSSKYFRSTEPQDINFFGAPNPLPGIPGSTTYGYQNAVLKLTSIVTNNLVNELRGTILRSTNDQTQNSDPSLYASNIYPQAAVGHGLLGGISPLPPQVAVQGMFLAGGTNDVLHHMVTMQEADQISWTHGKHTVRAGGEFEKVTWNWVGSWLSHGMMAFQTFPDFLIGLPGACGAAVLPGIDPARPNGCNGSAYSNVLNTNNFSVRSSPSGLVHGYRATDANMFVQDDIKVNQRLTVNLGVRWEYDGLPADKYGNLVNILPSAVLTNRVPATTQTPTIGVPFYPTGGSYAGFVVPSNYSTATYGPLLPGIVQSNHLIASGNDIPTDDFAPRVGFAWQPAGGNKFVVRGGFGFFYDRVPGNTIIHSVEQSPPYGPTLDQGPSTNQFSSLQDPFQHIPFGSYPIRWVNFGTNQGSDITQTSMADQMLTPLVYSWNLNFQYEVAPTWVIEVGYVGSHGIHQAETLHLIDEGAVASTSNPVNGVTVNAVPDPAHPGQYLSNSRLRVNYLGFSPTGMQYVDTIGDFKFNSFQATLRKQFSHGLTFQAAYTFSRAFSDLTFPGNGGSNGGANLNDPLNLRQQYGLNPQYRPQRLVVNYSWDIPNGGLKGVLGVLTKGWNLAGVTTIQGGQPVSIVDSRGGALYGLSGAIPIVLSRAQMAAGATYGDIVTPGGIETRLGGASAGSGYFAKGAFAAIPSADPTLPASVASGWGNSGIGVILGPGQVNFDTTLRKDTRVGGIHEDALLQFRAEFFNLFNHAQFNPAFNNLAIPNFGQIVSTSVNPRLIQLALKYVF